MHVYLTSDEHFHEHFVSSHHQFVYVCCCDFMSKSFNSSLISYHNCWRLQPRVERTTPYKFEPQPPFFFSEFKKISCAPLYYHTKIEHRFAYINRATLSLPYNQIISLYIQKKSASKQQQQWRPTQEAATRATREGEKRKKKNIEIMEKWSTIRNKQQSNRKYMCLKCVYAFVVMSPREMRTCSVTFRCWSLLTLFFNCRELCRLHLMCLAYAVFVAKIYQWIRKPQRTWRMRKTIQFRKIHTHTHSWNTEWMNWFSFSFPFHSQFRRSLKLSPIFRRTNS